MYEDELKGIACPECGGPITYNGNYYCQQWDGGTPTCRWALPGWEPDNPVWKWSRADAAVYRQTRVRP